MTTKYIHVRIHRIELGPNGMTKTHHPKGGVTYAYDLDGQSVRYAFAVCSSRDSYNRSIGRAVASGRLAKGQGITFTLEEGTKVVDQILKYDNELAKQQYEARK